MSLSEPLFERIKIENLATLQVYFGLKAFKLPKTQQILSPAAQLLALRYKNCHPIIIFAYPNIVTDNFCHSTIL